MVNIIISGALGKMGRKVYELCSSTEGVKAVCGVDIKTDCCINPDYVVYESFKQVKNADIKADVIIDFSNPSTLDGLLEYATSTGTGAVLCSTGYTDEDISKIKKASEKVAIFKSANMSYGVNVLIELVKEASKKLYGYDIEIIEKHHNQKIDAPSGTALMLADGIKEVLTDKFYTYGREGKVGKRNDKEIGIHAIRGGNIVGDHDVLFAGVSETITLSHQATDRSVFASGAIKASIYLANKTSGLYNMQDLLGNK